jgi:hypothetical protein
MESLYLVVVPPLWFYIINPRVDALRELANGKTPSNVYDNMSPFKEDDKRCKRVGYAYLTFCAIVMFAGALMTDWFTIEPSSINAHHFIKI